MPDVHEGWCSRCLTVYAYESLHPHIRKIAFYRIDIRNKCCLFLRAPRCGRHMLYHRDPFLCSSSSSCTIAIVRDLRYSPMAVNIALHNAIGAV